MHVALEGLSVDILHSIVESFVPGSAWGTPMLGPRFHFSGGKLNMLLTIYWFLEDSDALARVQ